jgi:broad specificity phosphatase PhoE
MTPTTPVRDDAGDAAADASDEARSTAQLWLVRHAATDWTGRRWCGRSDPELSAEGELQAQAVGAEVAAELAVGKHSVGARVRVRILTSPLRRAIRTAAAIEQAIGLTASLEVEDSLIEVDFGVADGLTWEEIEADHPSIAAELSAGRRPAWPGGESDAAVAARARVAVERIAAARDDGPVVVVSHGGLLEALASVIVEAGDPLLLSPGRFQRIAWPVPR